MRRHRLLFGALSVLLISILLWIQPLFFDRLIPQGDHATHLRWSSQFLSALEDGWMLPRWAYASHSGLGDPTFLYYAPLFYYLSSLFAWAGLSLENAVIWASWLPYPVIGGIVFGVAFRGSLTWPAVLGMALVVSCPALFFLSTHYGAFPWVMATPFCMLFVLESIKNRPAVHVLAVWLCLVCLTHVLSALMVLLCTGFARVIFSFPTQKTLYGNLLWLCGVALGLALGGYYLFPALSLQHLINPGGWTDDATLDWRRAFAFPLISYFEYGFRWFSIQWPMPVLALAMVGCVFLITGRPVHHTEPNLDRTHSTIARRLAIVALIGLVLGSELAYPLYAIFSPLQKLQWPYRFVVLSLVISSLGFALAAYATLRRAPVANVARVLTIAVVLVHCVATGTLQFNLLREGKPGPSLSDVMKGEFGQPEYLPATRGKDWHRYIEFGLLLGECRRLEARCEVVKQETHAFSATIDTARTIAIRLPIFAFPGWRVTVDGAEQRMSIDKDTGLTLVSLRPGRHEIAMRWTGLMAETMGKVVSVAALAVIIFLAFGRTALAPGERSVKEAPMG